MYRVAGVVKTIDSFLPNTPKMESTSHPSPHLLSIIIPTLNEAANLPALLRDLKRQKEISLQIIVGDGGSSDVTRALTESNDAQFVSSKRGRGAQMNAAAGQARGDFFLFLHADSRLEDPLLLANAMRVLIQEQQNGCRVAGHFGLKFIRATKRNPTAYRYIEEKSTLNRVNTTNGDQGMLLSREFFNQLGGFDETLPFLEDQRIAEKIRSEGKWITLPGRLNTSARRFEAEGFHRRYILMSMMMGLYSIGAHSFFVRAPEVYKVQQDTGKLFLSPIFYLIWRLMYEEWGVLGTIGIFYQLGRYIRQNSWQMFFFLDVRLGTMAGGGNYRCLNFHDRILAPCSNFRVFNAITGIACFTWFFGILAPFFWIIELEEL